MRNAIGMTLLAVMVVIAMAVPAQALDNVAYYRFEGAGTTFTDETGFHDGTGVTNIRVSPGAPGSGPNNSGFGGNGSVQRPIRSGDGPDNVASGEPADGADP